MGAAVGILTDAGEIIGISTELQTEAGAAVRIFTMVEAGAAVGIFTMVEAGAAVRIFTMVEAAVGILSQAAADGEMMHFH
jgi:hypothetical protein